jgi:acyl carrier protein
MVTRDATDRVVEFLRARRPDLVKLDPELDLIENRILDSLHFVEFLYLLEEATGTEISLEEVSPEDFRTMSRIRARFFDGTRAQS